MNAVYVRSYAPGDLDRDGLFVYLIVGVLAVGVYYDSRCFEVPCADFQGHYWGPGDLFVLLNESRDLDFRRGVLVLFVVVYRGFSAY